MKEPTEESFEKSHEKLEVQKNFYKEQISDVRARIKNEMEKLKEMEGEEEKAGNYFKNEYIKQSMEKREPSNYKETKKKSRNKKNSKGLKKVSKSMTQTKNKDFQKENIKAIENYTKTQEKSLNCKENSSKSKTKEDILKYRLH